MSFRVAAKTAKNSENKQHRVGAVIVKGKRILSTGYNKYGYNSFSKKPTMHAEAAAILKLIKQKRMGDLVGSEIYVTRYTKGGKVGLARPCADCMRLIAAVGIHKVHYSTNSNISVTEVIK